MHVVKLSNLQFFCVQLWLLVLWRPLKSMWTDIDQRIMSKRAFLYYKLIRDIAHPIGLWFWHSPFKGEKEALSREKIHWNFIQWSTRMTMERTFGMLKGRWRILLKRKDVSLTHMPDFVTAYICLCNLCIVNSNGFDMEWTWEAQRDANSNLINMHNDMFHAGKTIKQMGRL